MADYVASALLAAQAQIAPQYTTAELRERQNPILRTGLSNQNYVMADVASIKKSEKRAVKGYQFKRKASTNGTARSHNFSGAQGDTAEVVLSWSTLTEEFASFMTAGADNIFDTQTQIANNLQQAMRNLRERMGSGLVTSLHAGRTTVANATIRNVVGNAINAGTDAFEISDKDQFFAFVRSLMNQHKYYGPLDMIVDSILDPMARRIAAQGSNNGQNLSYQLQGLNIMPHDILGTDVAVNAYPNGGVGIVLPANSFAFIPWIPSKYKNPKTGQSFMDFNGAYAVQKDDTGLDITYALRGYSQKVDGSANGGTTDDIRTDWQISIDIATQVQYLSNAGEAPIFETVLVP